MGSNDEEKKERTKVGGGRNACVKKKEPFNYYDC